VYGYGKNTGPGRTKVLFDGKHPAYTSENAGRTVIVASYSQLQACPSSGDAANKRRTLFGRIILDEAHSIRRCDQTKQGKILKSFKAPLRMLYTGSPVVDGIGDIDGYLAFLEFDAWSSEDDLNATQGDETRKSRYERFKADLAIEQATGRPHRTPVANPSPGVE
jgi:hypothetical protein